MKISDWKELGRATFEQFEHAARMVGAKPLKTKETVCDSHIDFLSFTTRNHPSIGWTEYKCDNVRMWARRYS